MKADEAIAQIARTYTLNENAMALEAAFAELMSVRREHRLSYADAADAFITAVLRARAAARGLSIAPAEKR
jgi:hypothetical protein